MMFKRAYINYPLFSLIFLLVARAARSENYITCGSPDDPVHLPDDSGTIQIIRNVSNCVFESRDNSNFVALFMSDLQLGDGESLVISSNGKESKNVTIEPPFDAGFLISGFIESKFTFNFNRGDNSSFTVRYYQKNDFLNLDCNTNQKIQLISVGKPNLYVTLNKTYSHPLHLEVTNARLDNTTIGHRLLSTTSSKVLVTFNGGDLQTSELKTSAALASCSSSLSYSKEFSVQINGPEASKVGGRYKCVNIYRIDDKEPNSHFEADFKDFLGVADTEDTLVLDDGIDILEIENKNSKPFIGRRHLLKGKTLAVIYDSPASQNPSIVQFRLTVEGCLYGGVVDNDGLLLFPPNGSTKTVRFSLPPNRLIESSSSEAVPINGLKVRLTEEDQVLGQFSQFLPPVLSPSGSTSRLDLQFNGDSSPLSNKLKVRQRTSKDCQKTFTVETGSALFTGGNDTSCTLTLASTADKLVRIGGSIPDYSLKVVSLSSGKTIYNNASMTQLPNMVLGQSYINFRLKPNARATSIVTPFENSTISQVNYTYSIKSLKNYPVMMRDENYSFNRSNYVITIVRSDLRSGEKIVVNGKDIGLTGPVRDDMIFKNVSVNVNITRPKTPTDFSTNREGYHIDVNGFDEIFDINSPDSSKGTLSLPLKIDAKRVFISISSRSPKTKSIKRVSYNITTINGTSIDKKAIILDSRSIQSKPLAFNRSGTTTSDTLLVILSSLNGTIPNTIINYEFKSCNRTTDVICDNSTRCVPRESLCKGVDYCEDGTDHAYKCETPDPKVIETGISGIAVFFLSLFMLTLGVMASLYGPGLYRSFESRFNRYSSFSSME